MTDELSDRQAKILDYIRYVTRVRNYPPSVREIGEAVRYRPPRSSSGLHPRLRRPAIKSSTRLGSARVEVSPSAP